MMILPLLSQVFAFNFNLKVLMCNFFLLENGVVVNLIIGVGFDLYFGFWVVWKSVHSSHHLIVARKIGFLVRGME